MSLEVDISRRLPGFTLRSRFNLKDDEGVLGLLGESGSGKSMALRCIAGIDRPDEGRIVLDGRVLFDSEKRIDVPAHQRRVGYLFQSYALFPTMTVLANVLVGSRGASRSERLERAREQVRRFRLEGLEDRRPSELSGGQQQRCALARIMANEPELLLLDEPFSALDGYLRWQLELELADTLRGFPGGVVFVSHSRDEVFRLCDRVCVMSDGRSGDVMATGELFDEPRTRAEALISGCKNLSAATPAGAGHPCDIRCEDWGVTLTCAREVDPCVCFAGVRAHYLAVVEADGRRVCAGGRAGVSYASCPNRIPCVVDRVIENPFSTIVMAQTPGGASLRLELEKAAWTSLEGPRSVTLSVSPADVMPLADETLRSPGPSRSAARTGGAHA